MSNSRMSDAEMAQISAVSLGLQNGEHIADLVESGSPRVWYRPKDG